jgi:hypothetical protein
MAEPKLWLVEGLLTCLVTAVPATVYLESESGDRDGVVVPSGKTELRFEVETTDAATR